MTVRKKNRKKNKVTMGKTQSKCELEGDVKFMEMHFPGSTVWLKKWKKVPYMFGGNIGVDKYAHLVKTIRAEVEKGKKRKGKCRSRAGRCRKVATAGRDVKEKQERE